MEEGLERRTVQRRILSDLETAGGNGGNGGNYALKKQTLEDLFNPPTGDNGFFWNEKKKKDKVDRGSLVD